MKVLIHRCYKNIFTLKIGLLFSILESISIFLFILTFLFFYLLVVCVYLKWMTCFFIETPWSHEFFFLVLFWQLTFFKQSSCTLPWPDVADFLNWHLVSCAERHVQHHLTFQQASGFFCFIRRPLAFSNSSNKHDLFRLAPKQTRRPVKTPQEKMCWKKKAKTARL